MGYTAVEPHPAGIHPERCASRWDPSGRDFSRCMCARGKQVAMLYSRISASRPKTPAAGRNPLGSLPGASLAHVPPRNPLGAKESRAAVIPSFILLFSRDKLEPKPLLPFPFNQGMGQDPIPWKRVFPLSLGARRKVRMLWERCSIPWMQTQELCLGCKDGTLEGAGKQRSILEDDPTHGMDLHFPGWNSAGSVCTEALEQRERGDLPCACGVGAIPHLGGKEAPGMCWMLPGIVSRVIPRDAAQRGRGRAGGHLCPRIPHRAPGAKPPKIPTNPEASEGFASPHPAFPEEQI